MHSFELMNPLLHSALHGAELVALLFVGMYFVSKLGE